MTQDSSEVGSSAAARPLFVGIDVAKDKLDLARSDSGQLLTVRNDPEGIEQIVRLLQAAHPQCIVLEATGGLERPLLEALLEAQLPVAQVNPSRVRHFAKGLGILAKSDPMDASVLVRFAELAAPRLAQKRSGQAAELEALLTCRRQLSRSRAEQANCLLSTASASAQRSLQAILKVLDRQIELLDQKIRKLIDADDDFKHLDRLLRSVPGVGPVLSATLAAELRELGKTDRRHISALVGVAPFDHDSGSFRGKRFIHGGRASVRCVLYMATLAAMRFNPVVHRFAERLARSGKAAKVTIVACMRKLLTLLNAMIRDNLLWSELNVVKSLDL